jgi:ABC-type transporter Mla MlaB component
VLKVEGNLQGEWVGELRRAWLSIRDIAARAPIRVELADVPFVDAAGKVLLTEMHRQRVEITALGRLARAIRDEIVAGSSANRSG